MSFLSKISCTSSPNIIYSSNTVVDRIPIDILRIIASCFDTPEDVIHFGLANRRLSQIISDGQLWDLFLQKDFPDSYANLKSHTQSPAFYKQLRNIANNIKNGKYNLRTLEFPSEVISIAVYEGKLIASSWDTAIKILDLKTGKELKTLSGHQSGVACTTVCNDKLVSGSLDNTIKIWDPKTGKELQMLGGHQGPIICLTITEDRLISGSHDNTIKIWDLQTGQELQTLNGHQGWVTCVAVYDGKVISGSQDKTIKIWDLKTGQEPQILEGHQEPVTCIAVYGDKLISGSWDKTIKIWDLKTGEELDTLKGHQDWISDIVVFDHKLFSSSWDTTIKIWDLKTGQELQTLDEHQDQVTCLTIYNNQLISGSEDNTIRVWNFSPVLKESLLLADLEIATKEEDFSPVLEASPLLADLGIVTKEDYSQKLNCHPSDLAERGISSPEDLQVLFNSPDFQYLEITAEEVTKNPVQLQTRAFNKQEVVSTFLDKLIAAAKQKSDEAQQCSVVRDENGNVYGVVNPWIAFLKKLNSAQAALNTLGLTRNELLEKFSPESYEKIVQGANALIDEFRTLERGTQILRLHAYINQWGIIGVWNKLRDQGVHNLRDIAPQDIFNMAE